MHEKQDPARPGRKGHRNSVDSKRLGCEQGLAPYKTVEKHQLHIEALPDVSDSVTTDQEGAATLLRHGKEAQRTAQVVHL